VDLALSLVIIFVLGALTFRALIFVHGEAQLAVFKRRPRPAGGGGSPATRPDRRGDTDRGDNS
jgi:hypothetical protein